MTELVLLPKTSPQPPVAMTTGVGAERPDLHGAHVLRDDADAAPSR
jgi:hypothetical protein